MAETCPPGAVLSALLDDELPPRRRRRVLGHAAGCAACADEVAGLRRVRSQLRSLPLRRAPEGLLEQVPPRARSRPDRAGRRAAERLAVGAMVLAVAVSGALAWGGGPAASPTVAPAVEAAADGDAAALRPAARRPGQLARAGAIGPADAPAVATGPSEAVRTVLGGTVWDRAALADTPPATDEADGSQGAVARLLDAVVGWWRDLAGR